MNLKLRVFVVTVVIVGAASGLLLRAVRVSRDAAYANACSSNLSRIALALHQYHSDFGCFPPAYLADSKGTPMHSWRVLVLQYIDVVLYSKYNFNEPWDGPSNTILVGQIPSVYRCPRPDNINNLFCTNYVIITGNGTAFPGLRSTKISDCLKDTDATILVVETSDALIQWTEPKDMCIDKMSFKINDDKKISISSHDGTVGPGVAFISGMTVRLQKDLDERKLEQMLYIQL